MVPFPHPKHVLLDAPVIESIPAEVVGCDLCPARAGVYVAFVTMDANIGLLSFCEHHAREVHDGLLIKHPDAVFTGVS